MRIISISKILKDCINSSKIYLTLYANNGYELGFGKGGSYKGHSHLYFYDILFSPDGIYLGNKYKEKKTYYFICIPPRTYMNDIRIGNFFFLKFCPTNEKFLLPEKTNRIMYEGEIKMYTDAVQFDSVWYKNPFNKGHIWIEATLDYLDINFNNQHKLRIIK